MNFSNAFRGELPVEVLEAASKLFEKRRKNGFYRWSVRVPPPENLSRFFEFVRRQLPTSGTGLTEWRRDLMRIDVQAVARELHPAICALDVLHTNLTDNKLALLFAELTAAYWQLDPLFFWFWKAGATSAAKQHLPDLIRLYSCYGARNTAMEPEWPPEKFAPFSKGVVNPVFRNFMAEALMHSGHVALFLTAFPDAHIDRPLPWWPASKVPLPPRPPLSSLKDLTGVAVMRQLREPWKELLKMPIEVIDNLLRLYPRHVRLHTFLALQGKIPFFAAAEAASREEYEQRLAHHGHLLPSVPHRLYAIDLYSEAVWSYLKALNPVPCASYDTFRCAIDAFTHGLLRNFPLKKYGAVVAGGGVIASLLSEGGDENSIKEQFVKQGYGKSDFDVFFIGQKTDREVEAAVRGFYEEMRSRTKNQCMMIQIGKYSCVLIFGYPYRPIEYKFLAAPMRGHSISLNPFSANLTTLVAILAFSDVDVTASFFDGQSVFLSARALSALVTRTNIARSDLACIRGHSSYAGRLNKYETRGFKTAQLDFTSPHKVKAEEDVLVIDMATAAGNNQGKDAIPYGPEWTWEKISREMNTRSQFDNGGDDYWTSKWTAVYTVCQSPESFAVGSPYCDGPFSVVRYERFEGPISGEGTLP